MIRDTSAQDSVLTASPWQGKRRLLTWSALTIAVIIGAVLVLSAWRGSSQSVNASRVRLATVGHGTLVRDATVNGRIVAAVSPTLFSTAAGPVTLKVKAGDTVKKGQVLAEVESPDITEALKREQSTYDQLQAEVERQKILANKQKLLARRDADQAEIDRISAQRTYQRIEEAGKLGVVSKYDFYKAQDTLKSAEIHSKHAQAAAELEGQDVSLALKTKINELDRQKLALSYAQRRVDELSVRAPVDGFIGSLAISNRTVVAANTALLTVVDLSQLEVELEIPETYVTDLGLGMHAEILMGESKATGILSSLSPEVKDSQVLARVRFDGTQPAGLRQSQRVSARLLIEERPNVMLVQRGPFLEQLGGRYAYVLNNGIAEKRAITVGGSSVTSVQITAGLHDGDQVVIAGSDSFNNADRVSINN